jgi:hypothetical protein
VNELHVLNLGAGVQSTFLYLAFMRGFFDLPKLDAAIFADTGDEPGAEARELGLPDTPGSVYAHVDWLKSLGGPPIFGGSVGVLSEHLRDGHLSHRATKARFAAIPAFTTDGESKGRTKRQCSKEYKIEVIGKVLRREILGLAPGRSPKGMIVHQYIGFSLDEAGRAARLKKIPCPKYIRRHFPLVEKFITRMQIVSWLQREYPEHHVPRSACVECPFHSDDEWLRIKSVPLDWARAVRVDESLRTTGSVANRDMTQTMYLHRSMQPLVQIDFKPSTDERSKQSNINFAPECMGVCGI